MQLVYAKEIIQDVVLALDSGAAKSEIRRVALDGLMAIQDGLLGLDARPILRLHWQRERYPEAWLRFDHTEESIQDSIIRAFKQVGWIIQPQDAGGKEIRRRLMRTGLKIPRGGLGELPDGWPDLLAIGPRGRVAFIEVKKPERLEPGFQGRLVQASAPGKPTTEQAKFLQTVYSMGHRAGVAWSLQDALEIAGIRKRA